LNGIGKTVFGLLCEQDDQTQQVKNQKPHRSEKNRKTISATIPKTSQKETQWFSIKYFNLKKPIDNIIIL
jgi:hypothetical protein